MLFYVYIISKIGSTASKTPSPTKVYTGMMRKSPQLLAVGIKETGVSCMSGTQNLNFKLLVQPMPNHDPAFLECCTLHPHNDGGVRMPHLGDEDRIFPPSKIVEIVDHLKLLRRQS